jgi:hypothetical protein
MRLFDFPVTIKFYKSHYCFDHARMTCHSISLRVDEMLKYRTKEFSSNFRKEDSLIQVSNWNNRNNCRLYVIGERVGKGDRVESEVIVFWSHARFGASSEHLWLCGSKVVLREYTRRFIAIKTKISPAPRARLHFLVKSHSLPARSRTATIFICVHRRKRDEANLFSCMTKILQPKNYFYFSFVREIGN